MAHYLDFYYKNININKPKEELEAGSFFRTFKNKHKDYIKTLSYTRNPRLNTSEGFAEFVRLWTTQYNNIQTKNPKLVEDFEKRLSKDKTLYNKMITYRDNAHKFYYQGIEANLRATSDGDLTLKAKIKDISATKYGSKWRQRTIDQNHSIKLIEHSLHNDVAKDARDSAYKQFQLIKGAKGASDMVFKYGTIKVVDGDLTLDESTSGLDIIFKPIMKKGHKRIKLMEDYFKARRGAELKKQNRENLLTDQFIEMGLSYADTHPEFKKAFEDYQIFNNKMLDFYVHMKLITTSQRKNFKENNENYVPFHRLRESLEQGKAVSSPTIGKRLTGGTEPIGNIMDNIYNSVARNVQDAFISKAKSQLFKMIDNEKGAEFAVKIRPSSEKVKIDIQQQAKNIDQVMKDLGLTITKDGDIFPSENIDIKDIQENLAKNPSALEFFTHGHKPNSQNGYIESVILDDKRVYFEVIDPLLADTLTSFTGLNLNGILGNAVKLAMFHKSLSTWMVTTSPLFYLTNAIRDTNSAGALSTHGFLTGLSTLIGMWFFARKNEVYKRFMVAGGGYSTRRTALGAYDGIVTNDRIQRKLDWVSKILASPVSILEWGADVFELGTRIAESNLSYKAGESNLEGSFKGREIGTDFAIGGSNKYGGIILSLIPFAKAGINSIDKLARTAFGKDGKKKFYIYGAGLATLSLVLLMANKDDERYKRLTADQKNMYWYIYWDMIPGLEDVKHITKVAKPYDIGNFFASIPEMLFERGYNSMKGDKFAQDEFLERLWFGMVQMGGVLDLPSVLKTTWEIQKNKNWNGIPIESMSLQNRAKHLRYKETTPEIYKKMGNSRLSPVQVHHLANGTLGLYGRMLDDITQAISWDTKTKGVRPFARTNPFDYFAQRLQGKEVESRTKYDKEFYEFYNDSMKAKGSLNSLDKVALDSQEDYYAYIREFNNEESQKLISINGRVKYIQKELKVLSNRMKQTRYSLSYKTSEAKEKAMNSISESKHKLLKAQVNIIKQEMSKK